MRVGFIGLGDQGGGMALAIAKSGFELTLWARRAASLDRFADTGASVATTPAELGSHSDLLGICVVDDAGVREVVAGVLPGMRPGGIIAIHSTVHPDTCIDMALLAADRGISVIDAPVSGGGDAAARGELLVMVGGDEETVDRSRPVLACFGNPICHLGPLGSGQRAKLINNALMAAHFGTARDAIRLGQQLGIDPDALGTVLEQGSGRSFALSTYLLSRSMPEIAPQIRPLLRKDVDILSTLCTDAGADPGMLVAMADHSVVQLEAEGVADR